MPLLAALEAAVDSEMGDVVSMVAGHPHLTDMDAPPSMMRRERCQVSGCTNNTGTVVLTLGWLRAGVQGYVVSGKVFWGCALIRVLDVLIPLCF